MRLLLACVGAIAGGVLAVPLAGLIVLSAGLIVLAVIPALLAFGIWACAFFAFDWLVDQLP